MYRSVRMSAGESPRFVSSTMAGSINNSSAHTPPPSDPNTTWTVLQKSRSSPGALTNLMPGISGGDSGPSNQAMLEARELISASRDTQLRALPFYYPLERTATTIHTESLHALTDNISTFMKEQSISCSYNCQTGRFDALTMNLLRFSVQLWEARVLPLPKNRLLPVLVEIQRRQGCSIEMQRIRQELIQYLTRSVDRRDSCSGSDSTIHFNYFSRTCDKPLNEELLKTRIKEQFKTSYANDSSSTSSSVASVERSINDSFNIVLSLLKNSMLDQNRLGLECLTIISDFGNVLIEQAQYTSSKILAQGDEVQDLLLPYFVRIEISPRDQRSVHSMEYDHDEDDSGDRTFDYEQGTFFGGMHILALKVISHALETKAFMEGKQAPARLLSNDDGSNEIDNAPITLSTPFWNHALQAMMYNIRISQFRPLEAVLSIRCLRLLNTLVPEAWNKHGSIHFFISQRPFEDMLLDARSYGRRYYLDLEQETQTLLKQPRVTY
jgi:hypothetical protein